METINNIKNDSRKDEFEDNINIIIGMSKQIKAHDTLPLYKKAYLTPLDAAGLLSQYRNRKLSNIKPIHANEQEDKKYEQLIEFITSDENASVVTNLVNAKIPDDTEHPQMSLLYPDFLNSEVASNYPGIIVNFKNRITPMFPNYYRDTEGPLTPYQQECMDYVIKLTSRKNSSIID